MHGERDLLTRYVFPQLRAQAARRFVHVYEVDLRWGVTEQQTTTNKYVNTSFPGTCLVESHKVHLEISFGANLHVCLWC